MAIALIKVTKGLDKGVAFGETSRVTERGGGAGVTGAGIKFHWSTDVNRYKADLNG